MIQTQTTNVDRTCRHTVSIPHSGSGRRQVFQGDQGTLASPLSAGGGLTQQVSEHGEGWQEEWGKVRVRAWGCEKKTPERNPRKRRNTSLVIPTPAGGTGRGRPLRLSGYGAAEAGGPGAGGGGPPSAGAGGGGCCCGGGGSANTSKRNLSLPETQGAWARAHAEKQDL